METTSKSCGLLIFPGRLPQAPSGRQSAAPLNAHRLRANINSVPPKELVPTFQKTRERMPPPKPPLTAVSEPDPIYPYLPFLF
jgi:hypothetical protein